MNGPSEFGITGAIRGYEREGDLNAIAVPTLITCGEHDNARPATCRRYAAQMRDAEVAEFTGASHFTFDEAPDAYVARLREFLVSKEL